ncbi:A-kinase anchor protein 6 isoform 2-T3 [Discoglossus pictus]
MQQEFPDLVKGTGLLSVAPESETQSLTAEQEKEPPPPLLEGTAQPHFRSLSTESTTPKRPLQESSDHGGDSPTRPSLPKRGLFLSEGENWGPVDTIETTVAMNSPIRTLPMCPPSPRNHLSLSLTPPYSSSTALIPITQSNTAPEQLGSRELDSPLPQCPDGTEPLSGNSPYEPNTHQDSESQEHTLLDSPPQDIGASSWFGSDEFLALPSHLHQTDLLALHLGSLSQLVSPAPEDPQPPLRDVEDWEISSGSELGPSSPRCLSPSTPSDLASYTAGSGQSTPCTGGSGSKGRQDRAALIQRLLWDIQRQDNDRHVWDRIQGFVSKLDKLIRWLQEAMEATENWTPPQAETEALQQYLHTHLSFKQSVDGHSDLKDAVLEEGHRLMEVLVSHRPGFMEMLQMITSQWKELQRQIRRQHGWIMGALDTIKAEILQTDETLEEQTETQVNGPLSPVEAQIDAVSRMSLQLSSGQYTQSPQRSHQTSLECSQNSDSLHEMEADCQESLDWLLDMEATVQNNLGLLVSEDQHLQMCKRCSVEMSLREDRILSLLSRLDALKHEGPLLPDSILDKEGLIQEKWKLLKRSLSEALASSAPQPVLSPGSGSLVQQLDQRVKELKSWLRDTELTLYNSSLRTTDKGGHEAEGGGEEGLQRELHGFQSLCSELRLRRRGVMSILRLCHHLLSLQEQSSPQDPPTMQLLSINLERRWEAIVMQTTQWQRRLQRELGEEQEIDIVVDPDWADLNDAGVEEALEWDETDITAEPICSTPGDELITTEAPAQDSRRCSGQSVSGHLNHSGSFQAPVYQVYSLHNMELFRTDMDPTMGKDTKLGPMASLPLPFLQGGSFSSLPDLSSRSHQDRHYCLQKSQGGSSGHSESESGIASGGEGVTAANSEGCLSLDGEGPQGYQGQAEDMGQVVIPVQYYKTKHHSPLILPDCSILQKDRLKPGVQEKVQRATPKLCHSSLAGQGGTNRTMLPSSSEDHSPEDTIDFQDLIEVLSPQNSSPSSSSLESLSVNCEVLEPTGLRRSVSLESWPASYKSNEDLFSQHGSADITPGSEPGEELSKRTLDLLKRLEDIECPSEQKMKRSLSDDITLRSGAHEVSLSGLRSSPDRASSGNEDLGSELTELSSSEELSLKSEDLAVLKGRLLDSNASFRKHLSRSLGGEEGEANLSMIVNVSCTSACTDEEDDSDLLSSSTLTLTEEEDEEELDEPNFSLGSEDEAGDGTELPLGSDFIKRELQAWIRPSFLLPRERRKLSRTTKDVTGVSEKEKIWQSSLYRRYETNANGKVAGKDLTVRGEEKTMYNPNQLVDDMENGNVSDRLGITIDKVSKTSPSEGDIKQVRRPWVAITKTERLHPPSMPALAYHKPRELGSSCNGKSSLRVTCDAAGDVDMPESSCTAPDNAPEVSCAIESEGAPESSCTCHSSSHERSNSPECSTHDFVKEILDMTSTVLYGSPPHDGQNHGTGAQIREKVLEHSRKQLERGDFYSYLSLSSHDSDCGELSGSVRVTTPVVPMEEDGEDNMETLFESCTEEDSEQIGDQAAEPKVLSIVASSKPIAKIGQARITSQTTAIKGPHRRVPTSGQSITPKAPTGKFQSHSDSTIKVAGTKISNKTIPSTRELRSDNRTKSSTKPTVSSLPILHKRVREQRLTASCSSVSTGQQKKSSQGPKTPKDQ